MTNKACLLFVFFMVAVFAGTADAKLVKIGTAVITGGVAGPRGGGVGMPGIAGDSPGSTAYNLIYEDEQGIVWLDYSHGQGSWETQMSWAAGLNEPGVLTCTLDAGVNVSWEGEWRLPETPDGPRRHGYDGATTAGFNITTSELGYLYYKSLSNKGYYDIHGKPVDSDGWYPDAAWGPLNTGPFTNLKPVMYWSGTAYGLYPLHAWSFHFAFGDQGNIGFKCSYPYYGIAVRAARVETASTR